MIVGTEYGGYPCGWDTHAQAGKQVELRASGLPGLAWCVR